MHFATLFSSKFSSLRLRISLPFLLASLLLPATVRAQVSYTGTLPSVNFGSQAIGSPSAAKTLNFSVAAGTTVGSIGVLTQGAADLDFTNAAGSTCTATTYASAATCTVNVTFTPRYAGSQMGAVVFFSGAGNTGTALVKVPVYGVGSGPQIAYSPNMSFILNNLTRLFWTRKRVCLIVDAAGNLFITDFQNNRVIKAGGGRWGGIEPTVNGIGLNGPMGLAVDGAGDLFIADSGNSRVVVVPAGGGAATAIAPTVNGIGLSYPNGQFGLAVDRAGDLFIADSGNSRVVVVPAGGGAATAIDPMVDGEGLGFPVALAVDGAGDLFIVDQAPSRVVKVPAGGGAATAIDPLVNGQGLYLPYGVAVDGVDDLFIADSWNRRVVEAPAAVARRPPSTHW